MQPQSCGTGEDQSHSEPGRLEGSLRLSEGGRRGYGGRGHGGALRCVTLALLMRCVCVTPALLMCYALFLGELSEVRKMGNIQLKLGQHSLSIQ